MRDVHCDFCYAVVSERAWDCPTRSFDYDEPRASMDPAVAEIVDGSIGSWLACERCIGLVRNGRRTALAMRSVAQMKRRHRGSINWDVIERDVRHLHDQFWENREGEPVEIGAEQLALIASDPATIREPKV